jgi:hypothetical protein
MRVWRARIRQWYATHLSDLCELFALARLANAQLAIRISRRDLERARDALDAALQAEAAALADVRECEQKPHIDSHDPPAFLLRGNSTTERE